MSVRETSRERVMRVVQMHETAVGPGGIAPVDLEKKNTP